MAVDASAQLRAIAVRLREVGDTGNLNALRKSIRAGAAPLIPAVKQSAIERLPKGGGLNEQVASQKVSVSIRTGARTAGVRLTTTAPDTEQTNSGYVRHPTFGRRGKGDWKTQQIPDAAGWWTDPLTEKSQAVTPVILAELARLAAWVQGI